MKRIIFLSFAFSLTIISAGFSQSTDFFAGKWEFTIKGTPSGDSKLVTNLIRKEGKLTGELSDPANPTNEKIVITRIEETTDRINIFFTASGYDVNMDLGKVDEDNLKGSLLGMFESVGIRIKE